MEKEERDKILEKMGFYYQNLKMYPNRYWFNYIESYVDISPGDELEDIVEMIYQKGYDEGEKFGKIKRSNQIMALLKNTDIIE